MTKHIVLLGDSIFDNASYVGDEPSVIEHLRRRLGSPDRADLLAVDGSVIDTVYAQIARIPRTATHLVLSVGGNDALSVAESTLFTSVASVAEGLAVLAPPVVSFRENYERLIDALLDLNLPLTVCTIYDAIPRLGEANRVGLTGFNDAITRTAFSRRLNLIDLRLVCHDASDFAEVSPIEPSGSGGAKIARAIEIAAEGRWEGSRVIAHLDG